MDDKVVPIKPGVTPVVGERMPTLALALRDLADMAERGELQSFVGTGFTASGDRASIWCYDQSDDAYSILGAMAWLQHEYVNRATRGGY
jgi:hypothetical protein